MEELNAAVHEANVLRSFVQHEGFKILQREVEKKLADSRGEWLKADKDKAEEIRLQAKPWGEISSLLARLINKGEAAKFAEAQKEQQQ